MSDERHPAGDEPERHEPQSAGHEPGDDDVSEDGQIDRSHSDADAPGSEPWRDTGSGWGGDTEATESDADADAFGHAFGHDDGF